MEKYSGLLALALLISALIIYLKYYPEHEDDEDEETVDNEENVAQVVRQPLDLNDEDATVACLIACIEERQVSKKNVQVISVREVK